MLKTLMSLTISLLIGLLIGIERERSHPEGIQFIGVRTFTLLSILGNLVATLNQVVLTFTVSAFVFGLLGLNYFRYTFNQKQMVDSGMVTNLSAGIIFCLGYMVTVSPLAAVTLSAIILLVLIERKRLHYLARKKFKPHEMETAIILIIFTLGILPLLPNRTIDPWQLFNPRNFGLLMATIAGIQFAGYVSTHLFGERLGIALTGFCGGLVSSTAIFVLLPNTIKQHPQSIHATTASGILATVAMLVSIILIIMVASPTLLNVIIWPIMTMIVLGLIFTGVLLHYQVGPKKSPPSLSQFLNIFSIVRTSLFIGIVLLLVAIAKHYISTQGIIWLSFLGGLVEIQGVSLATGLLFLEHQLSKGDAGLILAAAVLASFLSKFILLWKLTPYPFAMQMSAFLLAMLLGGGVVYEIS